jgi:hypothetical protein
MDIRYHGCFGVHFIFRLGSMGSALLSLVDESRGDGVCYMICIRIMTRKIDGERKEDEIATLAWRGTVGQTIYLLDTYTARSGV